jgi:hypothetical protein
MGEGSLLLMFIWGWKEFLEIIILLKGIKKPKSYQEFV